MDEELISSYNERRNAIKDRLEKFGCLSERQKFYELIFCILTPQSNAKKCWKAVLKISKLNTWNEKNISEILARHTRFHNNKTKFVLKAEKAWEIIRHRLEHGNKPELRNFIAENVKGMGLKEASHFLRNIGKSDNKIAILDRHILRNLKALGIINEDRIKSKAHYFETEQKFLDFSKSANIPIDELDLLFWSRENGEIFK